jgi:hypothetical protein
VLVSFASILLYRKNTKISIVKIEKKCKLLFLSGLQAKKDLFLVFGHLVKTVKVGKIPKSFF